MYHVSLKFLMLRPRTNQLEVVSAVSACQWPPSGDKGSNPVSNERICFDLCVQKHFLTHHKCHRLYKQCIQLVQKSSVVSYRTHEETIDLPI